MSYWCARHCCHFRIISLTVRWRNQSQESKIEKGVQVEVEAWPEMHNLSHIWLWRNQLWKSLDRALDRSGLNEKYKEERHEKDNKLIYHAGTYNLEWLMWIKIMLHNDESNSLTWIFQNNKQKVNFLTGVWYASCDHWMLGVLWVAASLQIEWKWNYNLC